MDEIKMLRQYAERTSAAELPAMDVRDRVLATIRQGRTEEEPTTWAMRSLGWAAAASLLAAGTLGIYAQQMVAEWQDPLASLFSPLLVTLQ